MRQDQNGNCFTDAPYFETVVKDNPELQLAINPKFCKFLMGVADFDRTYKELDRFLRLRSESERQALQDITGKHSKEFDKKYPFAKNAKPLIIALEGISTGGRKPTIYSFNIDAFLEGIAKMCFINRYEPVFQDSILKELYSNKIIRQEILSATNRKLNLDSNSSDGLKISKSFLDVRDWVFNSPNEEIPYFDTVSMAYVFGFVKLPFSFALFTFLHKCHEAGIEKVYFEPELKVMKYSEAELTALRRVKFWMSVDTIVAYEDYLRKELRPDPFFSKLYHEIAQSKIKDDGSAKPSTYSYTDKDFEELENIGGRLFHLYGRYVYEDPNNFKMCIQGAKEPVEYAHPLIPYHISRRVKTIAENKKIVDRLRKKISKSG